MLDSLHLLGDAMSSFARHCVDGIEVDTERALDLLNQSLMLVTALTPHIGYDRAARIAQHAHANSLGLREAALAVGGISAADFDAWVVPGHMLGPDSF